MWLCPVCGAPLKENTSGYACARGHSFDRSRSGYVHLLPANRMHGKNPGDNRLMVEARQRFLSGGAYRPLAEQIADCAVRLVPDGCLLDVGCGEGYYTALIAQALQQNARRVSCYGIDISKIALAKAARACPQAGFAVASAFHLPVADGSLAGAVNIFAPYCGEEIGRTLAPGGVFLMAIPGAEHLWELKQALYTVPYKNQVKPFALEGLDLLETHELHYGMHLPDRQCVQDLFMMTPYYYKTGREDQQKLETATLPMVTAHFFVLAYRVQK